jgi:uncharacterized metal-binding protein YceD (DUF177 family)
MSGQHPDIIDLSRTPVGKHLYDITLDDAFFASLDKSEVLGGKVSAHVELTLREEDYALKMTVRGTVFVVCDRCLDPMPLEIDANDEMSASLNDAAELPNGEIDLSWLAYEIVSINIPIAHSHQAGECNKQMELLLHNHLCDAPEPEDDNSEL